MRKCIIGKYQRNGFVIVVIMKLRIDLMKRKCCKNFPDCDCEYDRRREEM